MLTYLYCAAQIRLAELKERRGDQGASMLEYVGVLVVVALIVGAVWAGFGDDIADTVETTVSDAIDSIFNQGGD